jgi:hypothetical protein
VALQAVPAVGVAWAGHGAGAGADVALVAVSPPVLLGVAAFGTTLAVALGRPREGLPTAVRGRLRWAAQAALVDVVVLAAATVLEGGVTAGAAAFAQALDDGSALWTLALLVVQGGLIDLRAPVAFGVAWVVLALALRPLRPRTARAARRLQAARTTRSSRDRRPG